MTELVRTLYLLNWHSITYLESVGRFCIISYW